MDPRLAAAAGSTKVSAMHAPDPNTTMSDSGQDVFHEAGQTCQPINAIQACAPPACNGNPMISSLPTTLEILSLQRLHVLDMEDVITIVATSKMALVKLPDS